ncbi:MAG: CHASE2 domain-containing protein [Candidatus Omnitrophica bacterium]|nr:CHASE2 domain-containing protein [Candidatus Omnitrophota bacterium]
MTKINFKKAVKPLLIVIVAAIFLAPSYFRILDQFELSTLDIRFKERPPRSFDKDLVIIHIGDETLKQLGEWPIPRKYHGLLVKALSSAGAKYIIFDIFFSENGPEDKLFADDIKSSPNVYMPYVFDIDLEDTKNPYYKAVGYLAPLIDTFKEACTVDGVTHVGYINVQPDIDGKVRRIIPFVECDGKFFPHLTLRIALEEKGIDFDSLKIYPEKKIVAAKDLIIPLDDKSTMLVNYPDVWSKAFRHYAYVDILQSYLANLTGAEPVVDLKELKNAVCFIGFTAAATPDAHPSPMERLYPGVGVHASVYNSIMKNEFIRRLGKIWNLMVLLLFWTLTGFITYRAPKRYALISIVGVIGSYLVLSMLIFWLAGLWIDVFYPVISISGVYIVFTFIKYLIEIRRREVLEKELDIAKDIQRSFLPTEIPSVGGLDISAKMVTARQVGGDLYDIIQIDDTKIGVMLGDVSGKGVPAALFMAKVVSLFKTFEDEDTVKTLTTMNNNLVRENASNLFVTLSYAVFDTVGKTLSYAAGGHNPMLYIDRDGAAHWIDSSEGMPLGLMECGFSGSTMPVEPGCVFVLYTDGVTEAMNMKGDMFTDQRLENLVKAMRGKTAAAIVDEIHKKVSEFEGKAPQHDDITVLVVCT